ncbi:MAG TPA: plasmid pRiA4b ORF-3 family protein [Terriglobia bacterium]|nr:plasmid pRiA4b ORF-3 family protein [Terriglobia bacterium]
MNERHSGSSVVYRLKVTVRGSRPPIWRRLQVAGDMSLNRLHLILQDLMGWQRLHPYQFDDGLAWYGQDFTDEDGEYTPVGEDDTQVPLAEVAPKEKARFEYHYDLDDILFEGTWCVTILVEQILPASANLRVPLCLAGKRAGPPDHFPGIGSYQECVIAFKDPTKPTHKDARKLLGDTFNPDAFDVEEANRRLAAIESLEREPEVWQRKASPTASGRPAIGGRWVYGSRGRRR